MKRNYTTLGFLIFLLLTSINTKAQKAKLIADIQVVGIGLKWQEVELGNHTTEENITGMSGLSAGINVPLPFNFETSLTAGFLCKLGFSSSTTYSNSGSSTSSESTTFFIPKVGLELSRAFIISDEKFVQGFKFGGGVDYYWPGELSLSRNSNHIYVNYEDNSGYFLRGQLVFRGFGKFQLIPTITYRNFTLEATDHSGSTSNSLHPSLQTLEVRNIELGIILIYGGK